MKQKLFDLNEEYSTASEDRRKEIKNEIIKLYQPDDIPGQEIVEKLEIKWRELQGKTSLTGSELTNHITDLESIEKLIQDYRSEVESELEKQKLLKLKQLIEE